MESQKDQYAKQVKEKDGIVNITNWRDVADESRLENKIGEDLVEPVFKKLEVETKLQEDILKVDELHGDAMNSDEMVGWNINPRWGDVTG